MFTLRLCVNGQVWYYLSHNGKLSSSVAVARRYGSKAAARKDALVEMSRFNATQFEVEKL